MWRTNKNMKRLNALLLGSLTLITLITGCATTQQIEPSYELENTSEIQSDLTIMSQEGFNSFVTLVQNEIFKTYDKNQDRAITKDELKAPESVFKMMDLDKNEKISKKEMSESKVIYFDGKSVKDFITEFFEKSLDKNKDKRISRSEFLGAFIDQNTNAEKEKYFKSLFTKNDINKDDVLTLSEYEDLHLQYWKRYMNVRVAEDGKLLIEFGEK
jgi:Ca2+-binding EF-hand superfamily protein